MNDNTTQPEKNDAVAGPVQRAVRPTLYGWYSDKAARMPGSYFLQHNYYGSPSRNELVYCPGGGSIYSTPDGREVRVTLVCESPTRHGSGWDDIVCLGEVCRWIRKAGELPLIYSRGMSWRPNVAIKPRRQASA